MGRRGPGHWKSTQGTKTSVILQSTSSQELLNFREGEMNRGETKIVGKQLVDETRPTTSQRQPVRSVPGSGSFRHLRPLPVSVTTISVPLFCQTLFMTFPFVCPTTLSLKPPDESQGPCKLLDHPTLDFNLDWYPSHLSSFFTRSISVVVDVSRTPFFFEHL